MERFARRFGVLLLCERHELPASHASPSLIRDELSWCWPRLAEDGESHIEPLSGWMGFVREAGHILRIAARLLREKLP